VCVSPFILSFSAMEDDEACITSLSLGLGIMGGHAPKKENKQKVPCLDLSFELCPKGEEEEEEAIDVDQQQHGDKAKGLLCLKHPNDETSPDSNNSNNGSRKKLKLTKEQSATLEDIFKLHSSLNPVLIFLSLFHSHNFVGNLDINF